ncbi:MAG: hypothetical protein JF607_00925 [Burkholderiales bacterium]|jgi:hypothetical protein|nr:hypothetical protein [Burkholderiales bacterium]
MTAAALVTLARFQPLVGSRFTLRLDDAAEVPAQLVDARPGHGGAPDCRQPFSLTFEAPSEPALPQRTYRLEHPQLGAMDIFLVPVARTAAGLHYEAVFG